MPKTAEARGIGRGPSRSHGLMRPSRKWPPRSCPAAQKDIHLTAVTAAAWPDRAPRGGLLQDRAQAHRHGTQRKPLPIPSARAGAATAAAGAAEADRKSTRLNSSHVEISYAVFCLKKK